MMSLNNLHLLLKFVFIFAVIVYSFLKQTWTTEIEGRHMILSGRLWQFFFGFLGHFAYESEFVQHYLKTEFKCKSSIIYRKRLKCLVLNYKTNLKMSTLFINACIIPLIALLCYDFIVFQQLNRLLVSLLTCLIISLPDQEENGFWKNSICVLIGNISYSTYLIHWPLFVAHRIFSIDSYTLNKEPTLYGKLM